MDVLYTILAGLLFVAVGYLIGSIPTAVLIARAHGIDIRKEGSHNAGGTNVGRVVGKKAGILTIVLDILKAFLPCLAVFLILTYTPFLSYLSAYDNLKELYVDLTAVGVCIGHTLPLYAGFKGGKCVACFAGFVIFVSPLIFVVACALFFLLFALFHRISLSSVIAVPFALLLFAVPTALDLTVLPSPSQFDGGAYFGPSCLLHLSYVTLVVAFLLALLVVLRHLSNIRRLERGEEPETKFKKD